MQVRLLHKCIRVQFWEVFECGFVMQEKNDSPGAPAGSPGLWKDSGN